MKRCPEKLIVCSNGGMLKEGGAMFEDYRFAKAATLGFFRPFAINVMFIAVFLGLADRVKAAYLPIDNLYGPACSQSSKVSYPDMSDYIDETWYYLLDSGQYHYLDNLQYNLMGESGYLLGHPTYPKLFERDSEQAVGFAGRGKADWLGSGGGPAAIVEYAVLRRRFNAGDLIDKVRYYYLDRGQYYYLDKDQYNLLGGLGYMFGRPSYLTLNDWGFRQDGRPGPFHSPEPTTIGFLGLGALLIYTSRRYNEGRQGKLTEPNRR